MLVSFVVLMDIGGVVISVYMVIFSFGGFIGMGMVSLIIVIGLINGMVYIFIVIVINIVGIGLVLILFNVVMLKGV